MDKLTKWGYFIPYIEKISIKDLSEIYIKEIFKRYGAPVKIILDRDPRFMSVFWEVFIAK